MQDKCFAFRSRAPGTCWDDTAGSKGAAFVPTTAGNVKRVRMNGRTH